MIEESRNESFKEKKWPMASNATARCRILARSRKCTLNLTMEVTSDLC